MVVKKNIPLFDSIAARDTVQLNIHIPASSLVYKLHDFFLEHQVNISNLSDQRFHFLWMQIKRVCMNEKVTKGKMLAQFIPH